ncbi:hypothetical protein ACFH04_08125 [Streptomyces noboritoensis]|uniref:Uncharacterized protein n=1 Tax=Streptomyces noboritoensis TaxID=67337 RepID=A0ABV6T8P2_9ACTN
MTRSTQTSPNRQASRRAWPISRHGRKRPWRPGHRWVPASSHRVLFPAGPQVQVNLKELPQQLPTPCGYA